MNSCLTMNGMILNKQDIEKLLETDEGRRQLKLHMYASKTAFCANQLLSYLENEIHITSRVFTSEEQQTIASLIYWCIFESKWERIDQYIRDVVKAYEKGDLDEFLTCGSHCGNC